MALLISTNMYKAEEFKRVLPYVEKWRGQVGVEVFPMFHQQIFAPLLEESTDILSRVPISFHGPYYKAEHSAPQGTPEYEYTMELVERTRPSAIQRGLTAVIWFFITTTVLSGIRRGCSGIPA